MPSTYDPPSPLLGEPKFIEIGFGSHSVTIFELLKPEDKYATYAYNSKPLMKQGICELIPVLNKVIPLLGQFKNMLLLHI